MNENIGCPRYHMINDQKAILLIGNLQIPAHYGPKKTPTSGEYHMVWRARLTNQVSPENRSSRKETARHDPTLDGLWYKIRSLVNPYDALLYPLHDYILFEDVATQWFKCDHDWDESTKVNYWRLLTKTILPLAKDRLCREVTHLYLQEQMKELADLGIKPYLRRRIIQMYRQIFDFAISARYIFFNPANGLNLPRTTKHIREALSQQQQHLLLESYVGCDYEVYVRLGLATGGRPHEILGLTWDDINLETGEVMINKVLARRTGESGQKEYYLRPYNKNRRDRKILLGTTEIEWLKEEKKRQIESRSVFPHRWNKNIPNLIVFKNYGNPVPLKDIEESMKKHCSHLGPNFPNATPYTLRHTAGSNMYEATHDILKVQEYLGHASIVNTEIYIHSRYEDMLAVAEIRSKMSL